jgi:hypothetical protein
MDGIDAIFDNTLATSVYFYIAVTAVVGFGTLVSWVEAAPARRRERWLRQTAR